MSLEAAIADGQSNLRKIEKELDAHLMGTERRIVAEITRAATAERNGVRKAVEGIMQQLAEEEERRSSITMATERRKLVAEREWRSALMEITQAADAECRECSAAISAQAEALDARFQASLNDLAKSEAALRAQLQALPSSFGENTSSFGELCDRLSARLEAQVAEQEEQLRTLRAEAEAASKAATEARARDAEHNRDREAAFERLIAAHEASEASACRELSESDAALEAASFALEAARSMLISEHWGGGGEATAAAGAAPADAAVDGAAASAMGASKSDDASAADDARWIQANSTVEALEEEVAALLTRCDAVATSIGREEARRALESERGSRVEALLRELESQMDSFEEELVKRRAQEAETAAEAVERDAAHALSEEMLRGQLEAERTAHVALKEEVAAYEAERASLEGACRALEAERDELRGQLAAAKAESLQREGDVRSESSRADAAEAAAERAKLKLSEEVEAAGALLARERQETTARVTALEERVGELTRALAASREDAARAASEAKARESAAAAVADEKERAHSHEVLVAQRALEEAMALVDGARNEAAEAAQASEASLFEMSERLAAAEDAQAEAEARAFRAAQRLRVPARFCPNGNSGGPADEIDAALTHVLRGGPPAPCGLGTHRQGLVLAQRARLLAARRPAGRGPNYFAPSSPYPSSSAPPAAILASKAAAAAAAAAAAGAGECGRAPTSAAASAAAACRQASSRAVCPLELWPPDGSRQRARRTHLPRE